MVNVTLAKNVPENRREFKKVDTPLEFVVHKFKQCPYFAT